MSKASELAPPRRPLKLDVLDVRQVRPLNAFAWRRVLALPLVLSLLAGCAGRPENVLQPVALTSNDTSRVDMLVATTRKPADDPGRLYSGERGTAISLNNLTVSIPPDARR